jgi:hypothetical protein
VKPRNLHYIYTVKSIDGVPEFQSANGLIMRHLLSPEPIIMGVLHL